MSIGKLLYVRQYQTIENTSTEFLLNMAKEFIAVCNQNTKCFNEKGADEILHLDFLSLMIGFDEELKKLNQMQNKMYIALENNDRYRILMYEKSPQDWTEEDEDFVAETYQNYFNANIPKVDDVIQSFIFHLEGKNFTPEMKNQYKENFTYQVTQIYESFFQTTLSYNSNKTALDMIKKYPKELY